MWRRACKCVVAQETATTSLASGLWSGMPFWGTVRGRSIHDYPEFGFIPAVPAAARRGGNSIKFSSWPRNDLHENI